MQYDQPSCYRPITLLNSLGKLCKSVVNARLQWYLEHSNFLPPTHLGFRKPNSCEQALLKLTKYIRINWSSNEVTTALFLDIKDDTVQHKRLLDKLDKANMPRYVRRWVQHFLTDRNTHLKWKNFCGEAFELSQGVPQGSPLSPTLYIVYNTMTLHIATRAGLQLIGWADNLVVYISSKYSSYIGLKWNTDALERYLRQLDAEWCRPYHQVLAPDKFKVMHFKWKLIPDRQGVKYRDSTISATNDAIQYLGVMLDHQLNWKEHTQIQCQKASSILLSLCWFFKLDKGPLHRAQVALYNMALIAVTNYACIVWGNAKPIAMKPLLTLQTTFICQITGFKYTATAQWKVFWDYIRSQSI
jgi:hypothetical protein